jgi:hypothetical protein
VLCLRFEADTKEGLQRIKKDFITALRPSFSILNKALTDEDFD